MNTTFEIRCLLLWILIRREDSIGFLSRIADWNITLNIVWCKNSNYNTSLIISWFKIKSLDRNGHFADKACLFDHQTSGRVFQTTFKTSTRVTHRIIMVCSMLMYICVDRFDGYRADVPIRGLDRFDSYCVDVGHTTTAAWWCGVWLDTSTPFRLRPGGDKFTPIWDKFFFFGPLGK